MYILDTISCGGISGIPTILPNLVSLVVNLIKIVVPILLVIYGMLDLAKAVMAQKDDEIKKGQKTFISRAIAAVIVFLVVAVVQLVFNLLAAQSDGEINNPMTCVNCFLNGAGSDYCNVE